MAKINKEQRNYALKQMVNAMNGVLRVRAELRNTVRDNQRQERAQAFIDEVLSKDVTNREFTIGRENGHRYVMFKLPDKYVPKQKNGVSENNCIADGIYLLSYSEDKDLSKQFLDQVKRFERELLFADSTEVLEQLEAALTIIKTKA